MDFDFTGELPKLAELLIGITAFAVLVAGLLGAVQLAQGGDRAATLAVGRRTKSRPRRGRERIQIAIFLTPALLLLAIGLVVPAIRTTILSFMDANGTKVIGLDNYVWMFSSPETLNVLKNTLIWVVLVPSVATSVGLLYAVLVDKSRFESVAKVLIFMPLAISFVGAGIIWKFVYAYRQAGAEQIGLLNQLMVSVGGTPQQWLLNAPWNTLFLIVVLIWVQAGFAMVILSAAIKAIPTEIVEAARLDGVNPWQMFSRVTLPSIRPAVVVVVVTISIGTLKVFDVVRTMTGGQFDTSVVANAMYNQAFRQDQPGHGSALAVFLFLLVSPIVIYQVRALRRQRQS
jgi:alpha-glucoside transport system permease protein